MFINNYFQHDMYRKTWPKLFVFKLCSTTLNFDEKSLFAVFFLEWNNWKITANQFFLLKFHCRENHYFCSGIYANPLIIYYIVFLKTGAVKETMAPLIIGMVPNLGSWRICSIAEIKRKWWRWSRQCAGGGLVEV